MSAPSQEYQDPQVTVQTHQDAIESHQDRLVELINNTVAGPIPSKDRFQKIMSWTCEAIDIFVEHHEVMYEAVEREHGDFIVLTTVEFENALSSEMEYLTMLGVDKIALIYLQAEMWKVYFKYPAGIPTILINDSWFYTACTLMQGVFNASGTNQIDWVSAIESLSASLAGVTTAVMDFPKLLSPGWSIVAVVSMVGGAGTAITQGMEAINILAN